MTHHHDVQASSGPTLSGLGLTVNVVDWESGMPNSRATRRDPRMPLLTEATGFSTWMSEGWGRRRA